MRILLSFALSATLIVRACNRRRPTKRAARAVSDETPATLAGRNARARPHRRCRPRRKLHKKCLDCHGTGVYAPDRRKITSLKALRKDVKRWGTYYAPALSEQEVEDITVWLNAMFYKF